jgi:lipid-binding SYLF domain-containing protein
MMTRMTLILSFSALPLVFAEEAVERLTQANKVFEEIMATPDKGIPRELVAKSRCVVIVPAMKKAGFIVGGQYGVGVANCRKAQGAGWTGPSTIRLEGGSFGLQIGGGETDVIMLVMNQTGADKLMKSSKFTIGGEGSAMAGPVGAKASTNTEALMKAEMLTYSRSKGAFAGVTLNGSSIKPDDDDNKKLYGKEVKHEDILQDRVPAPQTANELIATLTRYSVVPK